ncbi:MAG TPA: response regulator [Blastocatellia bacterium]|nr:response regulator [Blastocatellia bacterium]
MERQRILIIEKQPEMLEILRQWLQGSGFEADTAPDAETGWLQLYTCRPALVLLNQDLEQLSGYQFIRRVRATEKFSLIPIVAMIKGRDSAAEALRAGATAALRIPGELGAIVPTLERLTRRRPEAPDSPTRTAHDELDQ